MSGLRKAKKYDWKDSNIALFGSDTDKQVKKESAETEEAWQGAGQEVGLQIWRIVKFQVEHWPKDDYGKFYDGDSYIILNTYTEEDTEELNYDVHFWIGKYSSQDEYGTAAYKTVELDTLLDDKPVQHREVQGHESSLFKNYFPTMLVMNGGADTGFRHVTPEEYTTRLLQFNGKARNINIKEVPAVKERLNSDDVFILDAGLQLYQWNGSGANKDERFKAAQWVNQLKSERGTAELEVLDENDACCDFYDKLTGEDEEDDDETDGGDIKELYRISDADGSVEFEKVKEGDVGFGDLDSNDVFILDTGKGCYVWVGTNASSAEKKNGMAYAQKHLSSSDHPCAAISVLREGQKNADFTAAMAA